MHAPHLRFAQTHSGQHFGVEAMDDTSVHILPPWILVSMQLLGQLLIVWLKASIWCYWETWSCTSVVIVVSRATCADASIK